MRRASAGLSPVRAGALLAMLLAAAAHLRRRERVGVRVPATSRSKAPRSPIADAVERRARRGPRREPVRAAHGRARGRAAGAADHPGRRRSASACRTACWSGSRSAPPILVWRIGARRYLVDRDGRLFARLGDDAAARGRGAARRRGPARDVGRPVGRRPPRGGRPRRRDAARLARAGRRRQRGRGPDRRRRRHERLRRPGPPGQLVGRVRLLHAQPAHARPHPGPGPPAAQPAHRARAAARPGDPRVGDRRHLHRQADATSRARPPRRDSLAETR